MQQPYEKNAPTAASFLCLPHNLALMAGAGAGKTHSLISLALHALGGARSADPLPPSYLCALTFTEKAAAEMKERLRTRVRALADGQAKEPELLASFLHFGKEIPNAQFWENVYSKLGSAFIGTFHSFCAQILRRFSIELGIDPQFSLLEEGEASALFGRCAESCVLSDLESPPGTADERREESRRLVRAFSFKGKSDHGLRLLDLLAKLHTKLAEDGRAAITLPEPMLDIEKFATIRDSFCETIRDVIKLPQSPATERPGFFCASSLAQIEQATPEEATSALVAASEIADSIKLNVPRQVKPLLKELRDKAECFQSICSDAIAAPLHRDFIHVLVRAQEAYEAEKQRLRALDFSDLVRMARDLLQSSATARIEMQTRIGVLLVDEFQDTNRIQLDLVSLLCERRSGAPRPIAPSSCAFKELPFEPAMLVCVGDRKQSIYEFRGADVSVFSELAERFAAGDGAIEYLKQNRRSRPVLIELFNQLFAQSMRPSTGESARPWEVSYLPEHDDLVAWRPAGPPGPCAELLVVDGENSDEKREAEARAIADRIAHLLKPDAQEIVGESRGNENLRRAEGKDIAILLRRFTNIELYRKELLARSIPHVVVRGDGFFHAQEVIDIRCFLELLAEPDNRFALCAVLRSPLVLISDSTLALLAANQNLSINGLRKFVAVAAAISSSKNEPIVSKEDGACSQCEDPKERLRIGNFLEAFEKASFLASHATVAEAIEQAIEALDLEAVLAASFEGEQKIANLRKLIEWIRVGNPLGALVAARRMLELASEGREPQASVMEESDPKAVRIMTIHQAKGLEFPVVFVPECGGSINIDRDAALFDRIEGLCLRPLGDDGRSITTTASKTISDILTSRQKAESERLFYVAATRARDFLVFSGESSRKQISWRAHLDAYLETAGSISTQTSSPEFESAGSGVGGTGLLKVIDTSKEPAFSQQPQPAGVGAKAFQNLDRRQEKVESKQKTFGSNQSEKDAAQAQNGSLAAESLPPILARSPGQTKIYPNTLILSCEQLAAIWLERNRTSLPPARDPSLFALARKAMRWIDFSRPLRQELEAILKRERIGVESDKGAIFLQAMEHFLGSGIAKQLETTSPSRIWRSLPFLYRIDAESLTLQISGNIDLLAVLDDGTALLAMVASEWRPAQSPTQKSMRPPVPHQAKREPARSAQFADGMAQAKLAAQKTALWPDGIEQFRLACRALALRSFLPEQVPFRAILFEGATPGKGNLAVNGDRTRPSPAIWQPNPTELTEIKELVLDTAKWFRDELLESPKKYR